MYPLCSCVSLLLENNYCSDNESSFAAEKLSPSRLLSRKTGSRAAHESVRLLLYFTLLHHVGAPLFHVRSNRAYSSKTVSAVFVKFQNKN